MTIQKESKIEGSTKFNGLVWDWHVGDMNWYSARDICAELGGRMPTRDEMTELVNKYPEVAGRRLCGGFYWTDTIAEDGWFGSKRAWGLYIKNNDPSVNKPNTQKRNVDYYVCCVYDK